jgi:hypothetical protein
MPWNPFADPDDYIPVLGLTPMPWVIHSTNLATWTTKGPNCDACSALAGRSYPLAYWQATIMPGWHHNCDCRLSLAKSWVRESPHDLWGTEPYWWNPLQNPFAYIVGLFDRYLKYFATRTEGDRYSGFDVLEPVFQSNSGITYPSWTMLDFTIKPRAYGFAGIVGEQRALLEVFSRFLFAKLPWEQPTTDNTREPWKHKNPPYFDIRSLPR